MPPADRLKTLLVEDEFLIAMNLRVQLDKMGYSLCTPATTGEEAVKITASEHPNFVLMDINLAGKMNGLEAASIISAQYDVPIIFMTGYTDAVTQEQIQQAKPLGCLFKPIAIQELQSLLNSTFFQSPLPQRRTI
jgi:CheY-like chemotaxis protein